MLDNMYVLFVILSEKVTLWEQNNLCIVVNVPTTNIVSYAVGVSNATW